MKKRFNLVSLGCPKNLVDSEVVYGLLEEQGWVGVEDQADADVLLVNTCGFIQSAVEESLEEILQLARIKEAAPAVRLVVLGCLVQRYQQQLQQELPEVDLFIGTEGIGCVAGLLDRLLAGTLSERVVMPDSFLMDATIPRRLSTPFFRSWLKITEGCDNHCSYCLIPAIRGNLRSRKILDIIAEARILEKKGVKEVTLVAQDLTAYGDDLNESRLERLLSELLSRTTIPWIRLMYLYPSGITDELLQIVADDDRVLPYMDIPVQHASDSVLARMNRHYRYEDVLALLTRVRSRIADISLRTTIMVGFPGETEDDIEQLLTFLAQARFDHIGVFRYANEEGCPAERFSGQIDEAVKRQRADRVMALQADISADLLRRFVGRIEPVLIEGFSRETNLLLEGRTRFQAADVDGCVLINDGMASPGEILDVQITEAQVYDLVGRIVKTEQATGTPIDPD